MPPAVLLAVLLLAVSADARERRPVHPADDTEVFTGGEDATGAAAPRRPALGYWKVRATVQVPAPDRAFALSLLVPPSDGRQEVLARRTLARGLRFRETASPPNLRAEWQGPAGEARTVTYEVAVRVGEAPVAAPTTPVAALAPPPDAPDALRPEARIQSAAPAVVQRARRVVGGAVGVDEVVWSLYQYAASFLPAGEPRTPQDAAAVLEARRGTSLGRARALVALLRAAGVPARLVGGLRLGGSPEQRATASWAEAWVGTGWMPLDPAGGHFGTLPTSHLALYRGDLPLLTHTRGVPVTYAFHIRQATRRAVEEGEEETVHAEVGRQTPVRGAGGSAVQTHTAYVSAPVASVVLITDHSVPAAVTDRVLGEAREASIDLTLLTARLGSRWFRETYLEGLLAAHLPLIRQANLVLVATADDAGAYALMTLGERRLRLPDSRIVVAGAMSRPAALMLGSLLYRLVRPGEIAMVHRPADLLPLWEMARANLIDGTPMVEEAARWNVDALVLGEGGARLPRWRRPLLYAWARIVEAQVPLGALTLILVLPVIATLVVVARVVVGLETFGMFGPVIVSLAFITTGLWWGALIFVVIVGLGVALRAALQRLRLQAAARLAILVGLVSTVMGGLTFVGATLGIGQLLNVSIFPMVIMSNVIESFAASQVELGTRHAIRMTVSTLLLAIACYLVVDGAGLQSLVLAFPELLLVTVLVNVGLGKWRGLRVLEYVRFLGAVRRPGRAAAEAPRP